MLAESSVAPHELQNLALDEALAPHAGQIRARAVPQSSQNLLAAGFSAPQLEQITPSPSDSGPPPEA